MRPEEIEEQLACYRLLLEGKFEEVEIKSYFIDGSSKTTGETGWFQAIEGMNIIAIGKDILRRKLKQQKVEYPCPKCGKLQTKAEGGTHFPFCDKCWKAENQPTPTFRPWANASEVPLGAYIKLCGSVSIITAANEYGIYYGPFYRNYNRLTGILHSTDNGKTWKPCGVEETKLTI